MSDNSIELDKNFNREEIETKWSKLWLEKELFKADSTSKLSPYVIMMPPPNVTGVLHNGHALFVSLQDILARFWRMKGKDVLWLPGTDHAGIATQTVVERQLLKNENKTRHELGREKFLARVFEWKDKHGSQIIEQLKLMGASADWSRLRFTMDEQCSHAVKTAFVKLWDEGLIYRKERLVNWDPKTKTALSNEEVDHVEKTGELCYFAYRLKNSNEEIVVATTRVETMLGDVAVAVNPKDERYKHLVGQELIHPFFPERKILVIADDYVDKDFGSGAVKITPAHDPNDFKMGERHKLAFINIFTLDAQINELGGDFAGLDRFDARKEIKARLESLGLIRKVEPITHAVSISQRSGVDIEPMLSRQYFVDAKPLAKKAYDAVENGEVKLTPPSFKKIWDHFLLNIEDWCISRQLWWGHRIPVYYEIDKLKKAILDHENPELNCKLALKNNEPLNKVLRLALDELDEETIRNFSHALVDEHRDKSKFLQEEDVLDTWFSSGLWPFATLGWPEKTPDLAKYYPGDVLETGFDILFFWVARMMMLGIHFMQKPPFKDIYLHSMVRDSHGRKMSKSLGNAIDPIDVINGISLDDLLNKTKTYPVPKENLNKVLAGIKKDFPEGIPSAGADGLRLSLAIFSGQGRDVKFSVPRVLGYRAFLNKVWNATRFSLLNIDNNFSYQGINNLNLSLADKAIISKLHKTILKTEEAIKNYRFSEAAENLYHFFWDEYCDKYIECAKTSFKHDNAEQQEITKNVLVYLLDNSMRLLHPFCPFISEEIWQVLPSKRKHEEAGIDYCAVAPFPSFDEKLIDESAENIIELLFASCTMIKNGRQASGLSASLPVPVKLLAKDEKIKKLLEANQELISHLAKTSSLNFGLRGEEVKELSVINSSADVDAVLFLAGLIDVEKEISRLSQAQQKVLKEKAGLEARLANETFVNNAPDEVVSQVRSDLNAANEKYEQLSLGLDRLSKHSKAS